MPKVEARIDGHWVAIFWSHRLDWVERAFVVYRKIAPWPVRIRRRK